MDTKNWVRSARQLAGLTQEQLGNHLGMTKGNVSGWENGRHLPSFDQMLKISEITRQPLPAGAQQATETSAEYVGFARSPRRIPVIGTAKLGGDGFYEEISTAPGAGDGYLDIDSEDGHAYCLRVRGMSMFPAIRDGWYVLVEPNQRCQPGSYVLIRLRDGRKMVKELLFERDGTVEVMSINGGERLSIDRYDLEQERGMQAVGAVLPPWKWKPE